MKADFGDFATEGLCGGFREEKEFLPDSISVYDIVHALYCIFISLSQRHKWYRHIEEKIFPIQAL